jgi:hypothetical protein
MAVHRAEGSLKRFPTAVSAQNSGVEYATMIFRQEFQKRVRAKMAKRRRALMALKTYTPTLSCRVIVIEDETFKNELMESAVKIEQIIKKYKKRTKEKKASEGGAGE